MSGHVLNNVVEKAIGAGISHERISLALEKAGWKKEQVSAVMDAYADLDMGIAVPKPVVSATSRELFLYLLVFSALYSAVMSLGTILYQLINIYLPDPADSYMGGYYFLIGGVESKLRSGIAGLAVFLPVYLLVDARIEALKRADPMQGASAVRRKLTYLTLYLIALILMLDASSLISYWLSGELDLRVLMKCAVVAGIGLLVFGRYRYEMLSDEHPAGRHAKRVRLVSIAVLVLTSAIAAILAAQNISSPGTERKRQADRAREATLQQIDNAIGNYYRINSKLPRSLDAVERAQRVKFAHDPETRKPFRYEVVGDTTYQLCTKFNFERSAEDLMSEFGAYGYGSVASSFSVHPAGEFCFGLEAGETQGFGQPMMNEVEPAIIE